MDQNFGEYIRNLRKEKGLLLKDLAAKSGVTTVQLTNIEKGRCIPLSQTLAKIADGLEIDFDVLYNICYKADKN